MSLGRWEGEREESRAMTWRQLRREAGRTTKSASDGERKMKGLRDGPWRQR